MSATGTDTVETNTREMSDLRDNDSGNIPRMCKDDLRNLHKLAVTLVQESKAC